MRKIFLASLVLLAFLASLAFGLSANDRQAARQKLIVEARQLRTERDAMTVQLKNAQHQLREQAQRIAVLETKIEQQQEQKIATEPTLETVPPPTVSTDANAKKSYLFAELISASGKVIAQDARFRELLGNTKLSFRTSEGIHYYAVDELHPEVIRALGYDPIVLRRRVAEELQRAQLLGLQAQHQQDLRTKAAAEQAEREKGQAERLKAEAAIRDAEARERLAAAAERAATNPPKPQRIVQKVFLTVPRNPDEPKPKS